MAILLTISLSCFIASVSLAADGIYLSVEDAASVDGPLVFGKTLALQDAKAIGDFLLPSSLVDEKTRNPGNAVFTVHVNESGEYTLWARVRFPSGKPESFSLDFGEKKKTYLLGDGDPRQRKWHWTPMLQDGRPAKVFLESGKRTISLRPRSNTEQAVGSWTYGITRPMFCPRLNALCLTRDPHSPPNDVEASEALLCKTPVAEKAHEASSTAPHIPLQKVSDDLLEQLGKKRIPDWMRCPRFFTKDSHRFELSHRQPGDIAQIVRTIADAEANAFRLSVYWGGDAFFQSETTPHAPGLGEMDFLEEAVAEGRKRGVRIVAYMNPNALYKTHPLCSSVAIRNADGTPRDLAPYGRFKNAHYPCINHPAYRAFLDEVIREIFHRYEPDGLYIDGLSPHLCACEHCKAAYRKRWNESLPVDRLFATRMASVWWEMSAIPTPVGDPKDASMRRYTQFQAESLASITKLISRTAKSVNQDAVVIFHSWPKEDSAADYDGTLTEVYVSSPWRHGLWKACELADFSNQFSVPVLFNIYNRRHFSSAEARAYATQGLAGGCFPNYWNIMGMKPVFSLMRRCEGVFDSLTTVPVHYAVMARATHLHPAQRRVAHGKMRGENNVTRRAADLFLAPYVGLYSAVTRGGFPLHGVDRGRFHRVLDKVRVLCLANEACLSDEQVEAVRRYVEKGGGLIASHETSLYDENGLARDDFALADLFGGRFERTLPAKTRRYRAEQTHPVVGEKGAEVLASEGEFVAVEAAGAEVLAATEDGAPAILVHRYGKGRVVYLPGRLAAEQCTHLRPEVERLFTSALRYTGGPPPVELDPTAPVLVSAFDQPGRRVIHLVNVHGDTQYRTDRIEPVEKVRLTVRPPAGRKIRSVRRLGEGTARCDPGAEAVIELERLEEYDVLVVELTSDN